MSKVKDTGKEESVKAEEKPKGLTPQKGMAAMQGAGTVPADIPVSPDLPVSKPETAAQGDWKDLGIVNVPLAAIPDPDVSSPNDFKHNISWEDAKKCALQLPQLQKDVAAGKTGEDFSADDEAAGRSYTDPDGRRRLFDLYYGSQPVKLAKDGGKYFVGGGNHRIYAAKALGLETIPARVKEKQPPTGL